MTSNQPRPPGPPLDRRPPAADLFAAASAWLLAAALVTYLGVERGGFEQPVYSEVGIAAWWVVAIAALAGAGARGLGRDCWVAAALLGAFAGWTAFGVSWSESAGRSVEELARVITYLGVFAAALLLAGERRARLIAGAVASGIALIALLALLSRLQPGWFPDNRLPDVLLGTQSRLAYPLGYWNALAGLLAIGLPLLLWATLSARRTALRGFAAAAAPLLILAGYFTYSRAGIIAAVAALAILAGLSERRLALIAPLTPVVAAGAFLIWQASTREQLADGLETATANAQGDQLLALALLASSLSGLIVVVLAVARKRDRLSEVAAVPRATAVKLTALTALVATLAFVGAGGPSKVANGYSEFKDPMGLSDSSGRLASFAGNGRWQYWSEAVDAAASEPLLGIGPGTFAFWWAENRDIDNGLVRDAHSLFVETLGELGIVGLVLLVGFFGFVLVIGARRALRATGESRLLLAATTASFAAFAVAAGLDWLWEVAAVPVAALLVAASMLRSESGDGVDATSGPATSATRPRLVRAAAVVAAAVAIASIALPYRSDELLTESRERARAGDLDGALSAADGAIDLQPFAGEPRIQRALVLERRGELEQAALAARQATEREPTNWETWFVLARVQQQRDMVGSALIAFREAQDLNPNSQLLDPIRCDRNPSRC